MECKLCKKIFKSLKFLEKHKKKTPNCINKCNICLRLFSSKQSLIKHESVICQQKYECVQCHETFKTRYNVTKHKCDININNISDIIQKIPTDKQINININFNGKNIEVNNNSKNNNNNTNKMTNNFFDTNPKNFMFDYKTEDIDFEDLKKLNSYEEDLADKYMYEEDDFKKLHRDIVYTYDKKKLETEGMKMLFTRLQKDPMNRNVMIRKSKSGKCHIYETVWVEKKLQQIITKICNKLCDTLYDKETSMNHFFRLVIGSQPRRYIELRKHIEDEILNIKKDEVEMIE